MAGQLGSSAYSRGARHGHWHGEMVQCNERVRIHSTRRRRCRRVGHISALERAGLRGLYEGQKIAYDIVADKRTGKSSADNLKPG
jgi:hypothetical protein